MWENWTSVMGVRWWRWFLPLSSYIEQERWWECEFNERTKSFLREAGHNMLKDILADKLVTKPEKAHEDEVHCIDLQGSQNNFEQVNVYPTLKCASANDSCSRFPTSNERLQQIGNFFGNWNLSSEGRAARYIHGASV
jgi:hypothetical protein